VYQDGSRDRASATSISRPAFGCRLGGVDKAVQTDGCVEGGQTVLARSNGFRKVGVHLTDVVRIAAGKVGRDEREFLGDETSPVAMRVPSVP
jgi:hypothetical protein